MAKANGQLTGKSVGEWFSVLPFDEQAAFLGELHQRHDKMRQVKINALKRELALLNGSSNGHGPTAGKRRSKKTGKRGSKKGGVRVKYQDPKTGETWSGRGRTARWLAEKVKAGEKQDKYLVG